MTELMPSLMLGDLDLMSYPYGVVMDYELGAGEVAYESLVSQLLDGEVLASPRVGNRQLKLTVSIEGPTLADIADSAAALQLECDRDRNQITLDPGDGFAAATAYDTFRAGMSQVRDDSHEQNGFRLFDLTIPALPFARSVDLTVQPAVSVDTSLTIIDDCSSAANWESSEGTPVVSSGAVVFTESTGDRLVGLTRVGAIDMSSSPYLVVDWSSSSPLAGLGVYGTNGGAETLRTASPFGASWRRSYYYLPPGFTASRVGWIGGPLPAGATVSITQVATAKSLPDSSTAGHQQMLSIAPGGSARTQAQIEISTPANGLGEVTLFTSPSGKAYTPTIRRWLISSDTVITNAAGSYQPITGASIYEIPVSTLLPGGYSIWARMAATTTADVPIVWNAGSWVNGVAVGDAQGDATDCSFVANLWKMYPLGLATLPPAKVGAGGMVRVGIQRQASSSATVYLYDVFLFHESGDLTVVQCGLGTSAAGGASRQVRVLPPTADNPGGLLERGHATDWSDAFVAGSLATSRPARGHVLHPEGTSAFVFTEGTPNNSPASVSASWYKRWHTHAGD